MGLPNYSFSQETMVDLYNYEKNTFEAVNLLSLDENNYMLYLPKSTMSKALFDAYISKGEPVNLALLSTIQDISKAKSKLNEENGLKELYNFKLMRPELINLEALTKDEALNYIPQSESLFNLFNFYLEDNSVEESLYKTLIDTSAILREESKKASQK